MTKEVIIILGNQLVPDHPAFRKHPDAKIVMIEADDICRRHRYHVHKLQLVLTAMREYADALDRDVDYVPYQVGSTFENVLRGKLKQYSADHIIWMHASDRGPNRLLQTIAKDSDCKTTVYPNKQFMTSTKQFGGWLDSLNSKTPLMETFYRWQRKRLDVLMNGTKPEGDTWNYDHENRKPLPKKLPEIPYLPSIHASKHLTDVTKIMKTHFADNPGDPDTFWLPTSRRGAKRWLDAFINERLGSFGTYEDAMNKDEPFLFHSVLSPIINIGLVTPDECIEAAVTAYHNNKAPLNSVEGFVRQIIGWREFMYGLYWWKEDDFDKNFFGFTKPLEQWWYTNENIPDDVPEPVRVCLERVHQHGYSHHIERLMVFGNWFLLNEYDPRSVYDWFMSLYVDAYEWVMVPNVLGMSQYADGGMVATKPYVSGGNYLQKMGSWWESNDAAKDSVLTEKYWKFVYDNRSKFENNHRMSLVLSQARKKFE